MSWKRPFEPESGGGGGSGVSDHGALTGLDGDDHPQYLTQAEADALYKTLGYIPSWAEITSKPSTFPPIIGGTANQAVAGNDGRLTDARSPVAHKSSHVTGGADVLAASDVGAAPSSHVGSRNEHPVATTALDGLMVGADKAKLGGLPSPDDNCRLNLSAGQSLAHATWTDVIWTNELTDPRGWHSDVTNMQRVTPDSPGLYLIVGYMAWTLNATGNRLVRLLLNNGTVISQEVRDASIANNAPGGVTGVVGIAAGDFITLQLNQSSGGALSTAFSSNGPNISVVRIQ